MRAIVLTIALALVAGASVSLAPAPVQADMAAGSVQVAQVQADRRLPETRAEIQLSFAPLVRRTAPAVVNVYTRRIVAERRMSPLFDDPFFRQFFGDMAQRAPRERRQNSLGSGVIVDPSGLIVTNAHVIEGADEVRVVLADRREFAASVLQSDDRTDIALLRIDAAGADLPALPIGDSDGLEVGDLVLAIGNPFGVGQTVTQGIISAVARTQVPISDSGFFIQTDAAINPGNSGGALIDMQGRLIGVNTAIFSRSGGSIGIGFAIPSNLVRATVEAARGGGRIVRPWLGAEGQPVTQSVADALGLSPPRGVLLNQVSPNGPLGRAGLRSGDVVMTMAGQPVDDPAALRFRLATQAIGSEVPVGVWRDGRELMARLPVEAPPETPPRDVTELGGNSPLAGLVVANLNPALAEEMSVSDEAGVIVTALRRGSVAARVGFREGDVLETVNGRSISSVGDLRSILSQPQSRWRIDLRRGGRSFTMSFG